MLAKQGLHALLPGMDCCPAGHWTQAAADEIPVVLEKVPATHARHWAIEFAPVSDWYVPAAHGRHAALDADGVYIPTLQRVQTVLVDSEYDPGGHGMQDADEVPPVPLLYVPAGHPTTNVGVVV